MMRKRKQLKRLFRGKILNFEKFEFPGIFSLMVLFVYSWIFVLLLEYIYVVIELVVLILKELMKLPLSLRNMQYDFDWAV